MKDINGLVLNGGRSERMAMEKGMIEYHGLPQREFVFRLLRQYCDNVFVSCKSGMDIAPGLNPLPDQFDIQTPLNGILTAFSHDPQKAWLTVPVDMPMVNDLAIDTLIRARDKSFDATCFLDSDGLQAEPLICIWETRSSKLLADYYAKGQISPRRFLSSHNVKLVRPPFPGMSLNINTPEELEAFRLNQPFL